MSMTSHLRHWLGLKKKNEAISDRSLIAKEAKIGGRLFGTASKGYRREFFCVDSATWVWHESWLDPYTGKRQTSTTRYQIHPFAIIKDQDGGVSQEVTGDELYQFAQATDAYMRSVAAELYGRSI